MKVAEINGTYMGYMDVNGVRLWDAREIDSYHHEIRHVGEACLPSDSTRRVDSITLSQGDIDGAQRTKVELEELQRHDRKLREKLAQRRVKAGASISH